MARGVNCSLSMIARRANSAGNNHSSGTSRSAARSPASKVTAASGRSTSRDQCMVKPSGGFILYWVTSQKACPSSHARTCSSRAQSSGPDGSQPSNG